MRILRATESVVSVRSPILMVTGLKVASTPLVGMPVPSV